MATLSGKDMVPETARYMAAAENTDTSEATDHSLHSLCRQAPGPWETSQLHASYSRVSGPGASPPVT